jgi:hypothetical protein
VYWFPQERVIFRLLRELKLLAAVPTPVSEEAGLRSFTSSKEELDASGLRSVVGSSFGDVQFDEWDAYIEQLRQESLERKAIVEACGSRLVKPVRKAMA